MRAEKHKYPLKWYKQNSFEPLKICLKWAKSVLKSRFLGVKSEYLGLKNYELTAKLERQSGAKCNRQTQKVTKLKMDLVDFRV